MRRQFSRGTSLLLLTERRPARADVQGLRAIAVLLVVLFHAGLQVRGGFTGVDVFFVISGFVITGSLLAELRRTGKVRLLAFYARRARRLLPALALMITVVSLLGVLVTPLQIQRMEAKTGVAASLFVANLQLYHLPATGYFDTKVTADPFLHTWTLAVEEQFYVVFPALLLLGWALACRRRRPSPAIVGWAIALVSVASLGLSIALTYGLKLPGISTPRAFAFYSSPTRAWEFGVGALLAIVLGVRPALPRALANPLALAGLLAIAIGAVAIPGTDRFPGVLALLPVAGAAGVIAGWSDQSPVSRILGAGPAVWIGDRSYSWYLWHWPVLVAAGNLFPGVGGVRPVAAAFSLVPAAVSYRFVENPIRYHRGWTGRAIVGLVAAGILVPVVAAAGLLRANTALSTNSKLHSWARSQALHFDASHGCATYTPPPARSLVACTWRTAHSRGSVALIGDSNAGQLAEPVVAAARHADLDAVVLTPSGCPFVELRVTYPYGAPTTACKRFVVESLSWVIRVKPSLVIVAARTDFYLNDSAVSLAPLGSGPWTDSTASKAELWTTALAGVLTKLNEAGIPVVLVHPVPYLPTSPADCAVIRVLLGGCHDAVERRWVDRQLKLAVAVESRAATRASMTTLVSFEDDLCGGERCFVERRNTVMYRDPTHLSVDGAMTLLPQVESLIRVAATRVSSGPSRVLKDPAAANPR